MVHRQRDTPPTDAIGTAITPKLAICQAFEANTGKPPEESQGALMKGRGVKNYALGPRPSPLPLSKWARTSKLIGQQFGSVHRECKPRAKGWKYAISAIWLIAMSLVSGRSRHFCRETTLRKTVQFLVASNSLVSFAGKFVTRRGLPPFKRRLVCRSIEVRRGHFF